MPSPGTNAVLLRRVERVIRVLAPALDLMLAAGERISRLLEPDDQEYALARMAHAGESAPRALTRLPREPR
jgi:hypothetical protein